MVPCYRLPPSGLTDQAKPPQQASALVLRVVTHNAVEDISLARLPARADFFARLHIAAFIWVEFDMTNVN
jgi:hypothetical protein